MDCKITSTKPRSRAGFTLIELLLASSIGSMVLLAASTFSFYAGRSFCSMANYAELDKYSRNALDLMSTEIRQTNRLLDYSTNRLTFENYDGGTLVYAYDAVGRTLQRIRNGQIDAKPLLKECNFIQFSIFQRNPVGGTYDQYPAASPETCKLVQLRWICSRNLIGRQVNTESVQSAKIVIRRQ